MAGRIGSSAGRYLNGDWQHQKRTASSSTPISDRCTGAGDTAKGSGRPTTRAGYGLIDPMAALRAIGASSGGGNNGGNTGGGNNRDTTPPVIDDIGGYRSNDTLVLQWVTDEPTTTEVDFEGFGRFVGSGGLTTEHEMGFQIDPRSTYYFRVYAEDAAGNESRSGRWSSSP